MSILEPRQARVYNTKVMAERDEIYGKIGKAFSRSGAKILKDRKEGNASNSFSDLTKAVQQVGLTASDIQTVLDDPDAEEKLRKLQRNSGYQHKRLARHRHETISNSVLKYLKVYLEEKD
jgi:hypothetical protein